MSFKTIYSINYDQMLGAVAPATRQWNFNLLDELFKNFKLGKYFTTAWKKHSKFTKTAKFGCKVLKNRENTVLRSW